MTHAYLYFLSLLAARTVIVLIFVVAGFRIVGKRHLGNMHIYDLALVMALANAIQNAMTTGAGDLTAGFVCSGVLLLAGRALSRLFVRLPKFEHAIVGMPTIIIRDGEFQRDNLRREGLSYDQVMQAIREHGFASLHAVNLAVLETDGTISIVPAQKQDSPGDNAPKACDHDPDAAG